MPPSSSLFKSTLTALALAGTSLGAAASVVTFDFRLGGFVNGAGASMALPPISDVSGSFTLDFDPTRDANDSTAGLLIHALTGMIVDSDLGFTYFADDKVLVVGGLEGSSAYMSAGSNDFLLALDLSDLDHVQFLPCSSPLAICDRLGPDPTLAVSGYTTQGNVDYWFASLADSSVSAVAVNSVPEPTGGALAGIAALAAGLATRRRKPL